MSRCHELLEGSHAGSPGARRRRRDRVHRAPQGARGGHRPPPRPAHVLLTCAGACSCRRGASLPSRATRATPSSWAPPRRRACATAGQTAGHATTFTCWSSTPMRFVVVCARRGAVQLPRAMPVLVRVCVRMHDGRCCAASVRDAEPAYLRPHRRRDLGARALPV